MESISSPSGCVTFPPALKMLTVDSVRQQQAYHFSPNHCGCGTQSVIAQVFRLISKYNPILKKRSSQCSQFNLTEQ